MYTYIPRIIKQNLSREREKKCTLCSCNYLLYNFFPISLIYKHWRGGGGSSPPPLLWRRPWKVKEIIWNSNFLPKLYHRITDLLQTDFIQSGDGSNPRPPTHIQENVFLVVKPPRSGWGGGGKPHESIRKNEKDMNHQCLGWGVETLVVKPLKRNLCVSCLRSVCKVSVQPKREYIPVEKLIL